MIIVLAILFLLLLLGVPVVFSLGLTSLYFILSEGVNPMVMIQRVVQGINSFPYLAVPFFIFAGELMNTGGITKRLIRFADTLVGWIPGGLAHTNTVASIIFAGMSGAAIADAGGLGSVLIPSMKEKGYDGPFSAAVTAASSTIGPIIPPSIPLVLYGLQTGVPVSRLFMGGVIPGLIMGLSMMIMCYFMALKKQYPVSERPGLKLFLLGLKEGIIPLLMPLIVIGGIVFGIFTPTEASAIAVFYGLFIGVFVYKELKWKDLGPMLRISAIRTASVVVIVAFASLFGWILALGKVPETIASSLLAISENPFVILMIINLFLLVVGFFMEPVAAMLILIPVLVSTVTRVGISPLHFGLVMVLNLMIGLITPPVGFCLYIVTDIAKEPFEKVVKATLPFLIPLIITLLLITYFPGLVMFLPNLIFG